MRQQATHLHTPQNYVTAVRQSRDSSKQMNKKFSKNCSKQGKTTQVHAAIDYSMHLWGCNITSCNLYLGQIAAQERIGGQVTAVHTNAHSTRIQLCVRRNPHASRANQLAPGQWLCLHNNQVVFQPEERSDSSAIDTHTLLGMRPRA